MNDIDEQKLKAEIDEIVKKVDTIIRKIDELDPAKKQDSGPCEDEVNDHPQSGWL